MLLARFARTKLTLSHSIRIRTFFARRSVPAPSASRPLKLTMPRGSATIATATCPRLMAITTTKILYFEIFCWNVGANKRTQSRSKTIACFWVSPTARPIMTANWKISSPQCSTPTQTRTPARVRTSFQRTSSRKWVSERSERACFEEDENTSHYETNIILFHSIHFRTFFARRSSSFKKLSNPSSLILSSN